MIDFGSDAGQPRKSPVTRTVFSEFSQLAAEHQAVNLGQGFPDFDGPEQVKDAVIAALRAGHNQYAPSRGVAALHSAITQHSERFYAQRPESIVVTSGATEAIFDCVLAFVQPGDEVVLFEPFYDSYFAAVKQAQGVPKCVRLNPGPSGWSFSERALANAFSSRTKLVMLNTPHNPTGKVFTRDELMLIGTLAKTHGAVVMSDEVYEHITFKPHVRLATLPGMHDHTLTISSSGKSFSFTGWKVGWALGPERLAQALQAVHQWVTFATATPLQYGIATALTLDDAYFAQLRTDYARKCALLRDGLTRAGFTPLPVEGAYFIMADTGASDDVAFCRALTIDSKVAAIPPSVFYAADAPQNMARFAFCKNDDVLTQACERLEKRR